ncbi:MAG: hypothetical protein J0H47_11290 [Gammaproteobacteria bacterium]|nr:hypothetical protein [Gammaproteobacteria bacterium]
MSKKGASDSIESLEELQGKAQRIAWIKAKKGLDLKGLKTNIYPILLYPHQGNQEIPKRGQKQIIANIQSEINKAFLQLFDLAEKHPNKARDILKSIDNETINDWKTDPTGASDCYEFLAHNITQLRAAIKVDAPLVNVWRKPPAPSLEELQTKKQRISWIKAKKGLDLEALKINRYPIILYPQKGGKEIPKRELMQVNQNIQSEINKAFLQLFDLAEKHPEKARAILNQINKQTINNWKTDPNGAAKCYRFLAQHLTQLRMTIKSDSFAENVEQKHQRLDAAIARLASIDVEKRYYLATSQKRGIKGALTSRFQVFQDEKRPGQISSLQNSIKNAIDDMQRMKESLLSNGTADSDAILENVLGSIERQFARIETEIRRDKGELKGTSRMENTIKTLREELSQIHPANKNTPKDPSDTKSVKSKKH